MRCSICIATHDKPSLLKNTLRSIFSQPITDSGDVEVIVVDDRGIGSLNRRTCEAFPVKYLRLEGEPGFRNPARARNVAYREARGEIIICQSDDVMHGYDAIRRLTTELRRGEFLIATVWNVDDDLLPVGLRGHGVRGERIKLLTGSDNPRPLFFLGSLWREDLYAVGGNDEDFTVGGREDMWFADCLIKERRLTPRFIDVLGYHQDHDRPADTQEMSDLSAQVYRRKIAESKVTNHWMASGGPWSMTYV